MTTYDIELRERLADVLAAGRWLCINSEADGARRMMSRVAESSGLAQSNMLGLAVFGEDSEPSSDLDVVALGHPSSGDLVADVLQIPGLISDLSNEALGRIDSWDPDHQAKALVPPFLSNGPIGGRPVFGGRPAAWTALEDKLVVGELWKRSGIAVAASAAVELVDETAVVSAHRELASSQGTVWAVDNSKGVHGGAAGTHWVPDTARAEHLRRRLAGDGYRRVRIMPFLTGVPCSIHGVVLPDKTVALRPCEMLVFVEREQHRFRYARAANFWDPAPNRRAEMEAATVAVGRQLAAWVGFRGVFTLDGVMTPDGFRPTEVNPRFGMALPSLQPTSDGGTLNLFLLNMTIVADAIDVDGERFHQWLLPALESKRSGSSMVSSQDGPDHHRRGVVTTAENNGSSNGQLRLTNRGSDAEDTAEVVASVVWKDYGDRGLVDIEFGSACPVGPPVAPLVTEVVDLVRESWGCEIPAMVPACELR